LDCPAGTTYSESQIFNLGLTRGGTLGLEANGVMTLYNMGEAIGDACLTPATPTIQTVVTDNVLRVALRSTSVGNTQQAPGLNALIITPTALRFVLAPTTMNFGSQAIGGKSTQAVTVTNSGGAALLISSIGVSNNGDFAATSNCPASLAPNASCTVSITFSPPALGNRAATLNIATNTAPQTVPLAGSGTPRAPSFKHINVKVSPTPFSVPSAQQATAATERPHFLTSKDEKPQQSSISETKSVTTDSTGLVAARDNDGSGVREGYGLGVGTPSNCVKAHCPKDAGTRNLEEIDRYSPPIGNVDPIPHPAIQRGFALTVPLTKGYEVMFYGVVQLSKDHKTRGLFLVGGTHVFVGAEKEVIDDRYLILRLTTGSATIKDLQTQEQQALAIVPNAHRH
jgi:Abnormal spindle-like microcephaly-assoc'd, ASPM-SPD-2-Hydin